MRKFRIFWDFEAEEIYLHEMAAKGQILRKYSMFGVYQFVKGEPMDLNYKVDYKSFKNQQEYDNYVTLFEDAGWKMISGGRHAGSQYFLPMNAQAGSEIFSDVESASARYKKLYEMCTCTAALFTCDMVIFFNGRNNYLSTWGFLTPGLWERTGRDFWMAFLFELPFASIRILSPLLLLVMACVYGYWACRSKKAYNERMKGTTEYEKDKI